MRDIIDKSLICNLSISVHKSTQEIEVCAEFENELLQKFKAVNVSPIYVYTKANSQVDVLRIMVDEALDSIKQEVLNSFLKGKA